ncbi:hypothetical protein RvY_04631 [Ramazzottius varieornatus]|uniref:Uncharacterized protein n=1 Tax=Ramazzottius varieornatus TaxID=947166 RepID=A0A1D1UYZ5_RAMVA|nr:hypothetical protein RvY_04631 [Ramazzottius varieornatus]
MIIRLPAYTRVAYCPGHGTACAGILDKICSVRAGTAGDDTFPCRHTCIRRHCHVPPLRIHSQIPMQVSSPAVYVILRHSGKPLNRYPTLTAVRTKAGNRLKALFQRYGLGCTMYLYVMYAQSTPFYRQ